MTFSRPLSPEEAGDYAFLPGNGAALAVGDQQAAVENRQIGGCFPFLRIQDPGYSDRFTYDIQRLDMGIAACHFDLAAQREGLQGRITVLPAPSINLPENVFYVFSWLNKAAFSKTIVIQGERNDN
jgi:hypothetical protein